jgi:hypothetical protein
MRVTIYVPDLRYMTKDSLLIVFEGVHGSGQSEENRIACDSRNLKLRVAADEQRDH